MFLPQASKIVPDKMNLKPACQLFLRISQNYRLILKLDLAEEMKGHMSVDLLAHACVPNLDISSVLLSTCFSHQYQEMKEIFRMQLNFFKELYSYS